MIQHVNDNSKPLIFLGSSTNLYKIAEICDQHGIKVHGIIDSDYHGNTQELCGIPVVAPELIFRDPVQTQSLKQDFNFFLATNWMPMLDDVTTYNRKKRSRLIDLITEHRLNCVTLTSNRAEISQHATLGRNVLIDCFVLIEAFAQIGDFVSIYAFTGVGHHSVIGHNSVVQRQVSLTGNTRIGKNVYIGISSKIFKSNVLISDGTFIHEGITLHRGTRTNEIISLSGENMKRVTTQFAAN